MKENKPTIVRKVINPETSNTVRSALETVVAYGTGRNAYIEGYRVGGDEFCILTNNVTNFEFEKAKSICSCISIVLISYFSRAWFL